MPQERCLPPTRRSPARSTVDFGKRDLHGGPIKAPQDAEQEHESDLPSRKIRGMTQTELALVVGVSFQEIQKYEKGMNRANPTRLKRIADALGAPVEDFTGDLPPSVRFKATELLAALRIPGAADLVALYAKIEKRSARRKALELLQRLADGDSATAEPRRARRCRAPVE